MNVLDLFSGIGGFSLGLERAGMKTIAFCEIEEFTRKVLHKHWPNVPIFEDIRKLHGSDITEPVDLICGGYPCQPFSCAGKRQGQADDRHLWPEMFRLIREIRPNWVIAENVAGHVNMGLDSVLSDLESEGYETTTFIIPACAVNAPHRRDRVWIIANTRLLGCGQRRLQGCRETEKETCRWASSEAGRANNASTNPKSEQALPGTAGRTLRRIWHTGWRCCRHQQHGTTREEHRKLTRKGEGGRRGFLLRRRWKHLDTELD